MSNTTTTTAAVTETTTAFSLLDYYLSLISIPSITTEFYLWGYLVVFLLGFVGNTFSLLTFSRATLRNVSTGCLFILLASSDTLYLLINVIDFVEYGLQVRFYHHVAYDELCRFRVFTVCVAQLFSAWLVVIIATDRWIRTRFPFKANSLCTPKTALLAAGILLIIVIGLNCHILFPFFGGLLPGIPHLACGPNGVDPAYASFYFLQWTIIQIVTTSFGPTALMIIMIISMFLKVRTQKKTVAPQPQHSNADRSAGRNVRLHNQMFILMLSSVAVFFVTTLPLALYDTIIPYTITDIAGIEKLLANRTVFTWLQTLNCAVNFYVYCLTSNLFRKEFLQLVGINKAGGEISRTIQHQTKTIHVTPLPRPN